MRWPLIAAVLAALTIPVGTAGAADGPVIDAALLDRCLGATARGDGPADAREACIGAASDPCMDSPGGDTTVGMSLCLGQELDLWDARLNDAYHVAMTRAAATDKEMASMGSAAEKQAPLLRDMQRHWIAFRNAACGFERSRWGGGSGGGPASVDCLRTLTARQYLWLDQYRDDGM